MTRTRSLRAAAATLALGTVFTLLTSVTACAQPGGNAGTAGGNARRAERSGAAPRDSIPEMASRSRRKGADSAPVRLVEVSDFQCPFCRQFVEQTYRQFDSAYVRTGKVQLLFINYPLPNHKQAWAASEAAMCAGVQGSFWPMHDRIFAAQREWSGQGDAVQRFEAMAQALRLDMAAYRECTENDLVAPTIVNDLMEAAGAVRGTPSFFLLGPGGQRALSGAVTFQELSREIEAVMAVNAEAPAQPPAQPPARP